MPEHPPRRKISKEEVKRNPHVGLAKDEEIQEYKRLKEKLRELANESGDVLFGSLAVELDQMLGTNSKSAFREIEQRIDDAGIDIRRMKKTPDPVEEGAGEAIDRLGEVMQKNRRDSLRAKFPSSDISYQGAPRYPVPSTEVHGVYEGEPHHPVPTVYEESKPAEQSTPNEAHEELRKLLAQFGQGGLESDIASVAEAPAPAASVPSEPAPEASKEAEPAAPESAPKTDEEEKRPADQLKEKAEQYRQERLARIESGNDLPRKFGESKEQESGRFGKTMRWLGQQGAAYGKKLAGLPAEAAKDAFALAKGAGHAITHPFETWTATKSAAERAKNYSAYFLDRDKTITERGKKLGADLYKLGENYRKLPLKYKVYLSGGLIGLSVATGGAGLFLPLISGVRLTQRALAGLGTYTLAEGIMEKKIAEKEAETNMVRSKFDTWKKRGIAATAASLVAIGAPAEVLKEAFIGSEQGFEFIGAMMGHTSEHASGVAVSLGHEATHTPLQSEHFTTPKPEEYSNVSQTPPEAPPPVPHEAVHHAHHHIRHKTHPTQETSNAELRAKLETQFLNIWQREHLGTRDVESAMPPPDQIEAYINANLPQAHEAVAPASEMAHIGAQDHAYHEGTSQAPPQEQAPLPEQPPAPMPPENLTIEHTAPPPELPTISAPPIVEAAPMHLEPPPVHIETSPHVEPSSTHVEQPVVPTQPEPPAAPVEIAPTASVPSEVPPSVESTHIENTPAAAHPSIAESTDFKVNASGFAIDVGHAHAYNTSGGIRVVFGGDEAEREKKAFEWIMKNHADPQATVYYEVTKRNLFGIPTKHLAQVTWGGTAPSLPMIDPPGITKVPDINDLKTLAE